MRRPRRGVKRGAAAVDGGQTLRYAAHVGQRARVMIADPAADRPRAATTTTVTVCALCAGIAAAYGLQRAAGHDLRAGAKVAAPERAGDQRESGAHDAGAHPRPSQDDAVAEATLVAQPELAVEVPPSPPREGAAHEQPETAAESGPPDATVAADAPARMAIERPQATAPEPMAEAAPSEPLLRFVRGRLAYLRCEGVRQRTGAHPCPRDRDLEAQAWSALEAIERCDLLRDQRGKSEVWLEFQDGSTDLRVIEAQLDREAVRRCAGARLSAVRTALRHTRMIVSFRFELR
jgi:hypothetical protein